MGKSNKEFDGYDASMSEELERIADEYLKDYDDKDQIIGPSNDSDEEIGPASPGQKAFVSGGIEYDRDGLPVFDYKQYSTEELTELFGHYAEVVRTKPSKRETDEAITNTWQCLKGLARDIISKKFSRYIESHPELMEEFLSEAKVAILTSLERYDNTKAAPSTFFYWQICGELHRYVTANVHQIKTYRADLMKKIDEADRIFEEKGKIPTITDYCIMTGLEVTQVTDLLKIKEQKKGTLSLDEMYETAKMGEQFSQSRTDEDAISSVMEEKIEMVLREKLDDVEYTVFHAYAAETPCSVISEKTGIPLHDVHDIVKLSRMKLMEDPFIRSLKRVNDRTHHNIIKMTCDNLLPPEYMENLLDELMGENEAEEGNGVQYAKDYSDIPIA